jgi:tight adherence protein C
MGANPVLIGLAVFVAVLSALLVAYAGYFARARAIDDRLADIAIRARLRSGVLAQSDTPTDSRMRSRLAQWTVNRLPAPRTTTPRGERIVRMLGHAGYHGAEAIRHFNAIRLGAIAGGIGLVLLSGWMLGLAAPRIVLYGVAGAIAGNTAPVFILGMLATRRQRTIMRELSDILDLLVVCVESGLGLFQAIRTVGREAEQRGQVMGMELLLVSAGINSGSSLGQGLRAMGERTGVNEIKSLAAIMVQSEKLGAQLGPALRAVSDTLRGKRRLAAEEAAQKSTIKMLVPLVLFVLPAMMAMILGPGVVRIFHTFHLKR